MNHEMMREEGLVLLRALGMAHSAPGSEHGVRRIFREQLGEGAHTDRMGNIFQEKVGSQSGPRVMMTAHMDEVGFAVQTITKSGLIKFVPLGGWWGHTLLAQRVKILNREGREILGVIGSKPPHFLSDAERDKVIKIEDMYIDVGAMSAQEATEAFGIAPGDPIVPDSAFTSLSNPDVLLCKAFDNRAGTALMIHCMRLLQGVSHPNIVYAVGTVQEEVGARGAQTAGYSVEPDVAIVMEGTPADDLPGTPEEECQGKLGKGIQVRLMDPSAIMNRGLAQKALEVAEASRIPCQIAVRRSGGTDAKAIHLHRKGIPTLVLGVPARYIHTHNSIIHMDDYLGGLQLALELIKVLDENTVRSFTDYGI